MSVLSIISSAVRRIRRLFRHVASAESGLYNQRCHAGRWVETDAKSWLGKHYEVFA